MACETEDESLMEVARWRKLHLFGHANRNPGSVAPDVMHGLTDGARGGEEGHKELGHCRVDGIGILHV